MIDYYKKVRRTKLQLFSPVRWHEVMKRKGLSKLIFLGSEGERETKNQIETDSEEGFGLTKKGNGDGTKLTVVSRCCERRYALKGAVMTTTISTGNLTILFLLLNRCCQDNTL